MLLYCYDCASPVPTGNLLCPRCGGATLSKGAARPTETAQLETPPLPEPWAGVLQAWPEGSVVGIFGPKGSGKSSLCWRLRPDWVLTSEQTVHACAVALQRIQGADRRPTEIRTVRRPDDVRAKLGQVHQGLVVLDSITRCGGLHGAREALEALAEWCQAGPGRRAVGVLQVNAKGRPAGLTENEHLTDAIVGVAVEESGLRRLFAEKNRSGGLGSRYFQLTASGLEAGHFPYSYSVEGPAGAYRLEPYPSREARWQGVLHAAFSANEGARPGLASAGRLVPGYPGGRLEPADVEQRRIFAEAHGLEWFTG